MNLSCLALALLELLLWKMSADIVRESMVGFLSIAYQCLHGSVKRMPVVSPELGVGSLERRVSRGLRLLDTAVGCLISLLVLFLVVVSRFISTYPFR